jgi:hypothetical protein
VHRDGAPNIIYIVSLSRSEITRGFTQAVNFQEGYAMAAETGLLTSRVVVLYVTKAGNKTDSVLKII